MLSFMAEVVTVDRSTDGGERVRQGAATAVVVMAGAADGMVNATVEG
jgi:hypothetical protein